VNHYEVLGVDPGSDAAEIRRAYLAAARRHHPDFHADADDATRATTAQRMQAINEAWEVLRDPGARAGYDRTILTATDPGVARRAARESDLPGGKGWTPRLGDDGWMNDFEGWANETDSLAPDLPRSTGRNLATLAPMLLVAAAMLVGFLGLLLAVQALLAVAFICLILAGGLFVMLPMFEMSRSRQR
jgi:curved DNA-binding protein CbpA